MEVFMGTIQTFAFDFAPRGWALCQGQTLSVAQYTALYALLATRYGGNGSSTFQLPNLQGRTQVGQGTGANLTARVIGQSGGVEQNTLQVANLPPAPLAASGLTVNTTVNLAVTASNPATTPSATNAYLGASPASGPTSAGIYSDQQGASPVTLKGVSNTFSGSFSLPGSSAPLDNMDPFLVLNFSIALEGLFPSRN